MARTIPSSKLLPTTRAVTGRRIFMPATRRRDQIQSGMLEMRKLCIFLSAVLLLTAAASKPVHADVYYAGPYKAVEGSGRHTTIEAAAAQYWAQYWRPPTCSYSIELLDDVEHPSWAARMHSQGVWGEDNTPCVGSENILATQYAYNPDFALGGAQGDDGSACEHKAAPISNSVGNPIDVSVGNKFQVEVDIPCDGLLSFARYYNSHNAALNPMGYHWAHTYSRRLLYYPSTTATPEAVIERPDGKRYRFNLLGGIWTPPSNLTATLQRLDGVNGELLGWKYISAGKGETETYDALGRLTTISRRDASSISLKYNNDVIENNANDYLVSSVTSQDGRKLQFVEYNGPLVSKIIDASGGEYLYAYDSLNRLTGVTYPGGTTRIYKYELSNDPSSTNVFALTGIEDESGNRYATFGYLTDGRAYSTYHLGPNSQQVSKFVATYNSNGSATIAWPTGASEVRAFAAQDGVYRPSSSSVTANGQTDHMYVSYDANGYIDIVEDRAGVETDYDYDAAGLLSSITRAKGNSAQQVETITWDSALRVPTQVTRSGQRLNFTYNARGQRLSSRVTDTATTAFRQTTFTYCELANIPADCPLVGLLTAINGPRTDVTDTTRLVYRAADHADCADPTKACPYRIGDLHKIIDPLAHTTFFTKYDGAGRLLSMTDANGVVTDLEYSARGWLTASKVRGIDSGTEADDAITRIEYYNPGQVKKITRPDGAYVQFTYDTAHRLTDVTDALGNSIHYTLDAAGNRAQEDTKDSGAAIKATLARAFDDLGQLESILDGVNGLTEFTYDVNGAVDQVTDPRDHIADNTLDALGRVTQAIVNVNGSGPEKATSGFAYDSRDNLTQVTDPNGLNTGYTYNGFDEVTQLVSPDTGTTTYAYSLAGKVTAKTDARGIGSTYTHDELGRLTSQLMPTTAQNVYFLYDVPEADCQAGETFGIGRLAKITDESGSTRYCYDRHGNLVRKAQTVTGGTTLTTGATFDAAGQITARTLPSGAIVTYTRNANGQITRVDAKPTSTATQVTIVSSVSYAPFGPITSTTYGNGRVLSRVYDAAYRPDSLTDSVTDGLAADYTLDASGNVTALTERGTLARTYTYDGQDRVIEAKNAGVNVEAFEYDATGNRTKKTVGTVPSTYTYPTTSHRVTNVAGLGPRTYDAMGNTITNGSYTFPHDEHGRLREFHAGSTHHQTYLYNGLGERVIRIGVATPATTLQFVYDEEGRLLGEYTSAGVRVSEYVWLDDMLVGVLKSHDGTTYQYVETDHLGTPRAVISPATNVTIWRWDLTPTVFGDHTVDSNPDGNAVVYTLNLRYPGQYYNGLDFIGYNYYRDYDPRTGRYLQSDPIGLAGGMSTYSYVLSNPHALIDPLGLQTVVRDERSLIRPPSFYSMTTFQAARRDTSLEESVERGALFRDFTGPALIASGTATVSAVPAAPLVCTAGPAVAALARTPTAREVLFAALCAIGHCVLGRAPGGRVHQEQKIGEAREGMIREARRKDIELPDPKP
jgi:RHS repeat-associated protein